MVDPGGPPTIHVDSHEEEEENDEERTTEEPDHHPPVVPVRQYDGDYF